MTSEIKYSYGASYYAKALEAIIERVRLADDSRGMIQDIEQIAADTLEGVWQEGED